MKKFDPDKPFNDLPLLPPAADLETKAVLKKSISAGRMLAAFTRERILAIRKLMLETMEQTKKDLPDRVYSKELIELLFRQPYTKSRFLVEEGIAQRKTAAEYLKELEKLGVLESRKIGKEVLYLNTKLYELLSIEHV